MGKVPGVPKHGWAYTHHRPRRCRCERARVSEEPASEEKEQQRIRQINRKHPGMNSGDGFAEHRHERRVGQINPGKLMVPRDSVWRHAFENEPAYVSEFPFISFQGTSPQPPPNQKRRDEDRAE